MTASTTIGGAPLVVGLGGTLRANSSTERALRYCLESVEQQGGRTKFFSGPDLDLPMYAPHELERTPKALELVGALRDADAVVVGSPGYHGAISGLVKNALDYIEDLREDPRVYLDNAPWGCISCAYGWQAAVGTLGQLRSIGHALRAWPTPLGVAINSADEIWDDGGLLVDTTVQGQLDMLATQLLTFARAAWEQYQLPYTIVRPFNCVGIGESRALGDEEIMSGNVKLAMSHVVPDLVQKVYKGQDPLHILGTGEQVRHYTYGGDLAAGIVTAMEHPDALGEDFNLSTSESTTVLQLAELIWRKIKGPGVPLRVVHDEPFAHDVQRRVPSTDKAKRILGFEAATSLDQMLDEVIPWIAGAVETGTI